MVMRIPFLHMLMRLWNRYNPRRQFIECDDELIALMAQLGYVELYREEYFLTKEGKEAMMNGIREMERQYFITANSTENSYGGTE